jgi:hypothetical protein
VFLGLLFDLGGLRRRGAQWINDGLFFGAPDDKDPS